MTRILLATVAGFLLANSLDAGQPVPMAMPPGPKAAPTPAAPLPSSPTVPPQTMYDEPVAESGNCCGSRMGLLRRISAHWCGHRYAYVDTNCCNSSFPEYGNYTPVYSSVECGRVKFGCRERCRVRCREYRHCFGFGRFLRQGDDCEGERCRRGGCLSRVKEWFCWHPCKDKAHARCLTPTPYQSPVRYYFQGDSEQTCSGGTCTTSPFGECAGAGLSSGIGNRLRGEGAGIGARVAAGGEGVGIGGGCRGGHCRNKEQCLMTGQPFQGDLRFANNEKPKLPDVDASKPTFYDGYWRTQRYANTVREAGTVKQAGYQAPQK